MLEQEVISVIIEVIRKKSPLVSEAIETREVSGGCINRAFRIKTSDGNFFVKSNSALKFPGMFEAEASGLGILAESGEIAVPEVVGIGRSVNISFLVLDFIESAGQQPDFWKKFGRGLAALHKRTAIRFGLDHDNYIGSLLQKNGQKETWEEFFVVQRLLPQIKMAREGGLLQQTTERQFEKLFKHLADFFPNEEPSLLHGDLWGGNFMTGEKGQPVIFDPAVYYGHRYMDLGMTKLFGGFPESFYSYYNEAFPFETDWQKSIEVANLYPLLVHVNLFGGGYVSNVNQILKRFS